MKPKTSIAIPLALAFAAAFGLASVASAHQIIECVGQVLIKRGTAEYRSTGVGERLQPGDILRPASGARVKVLCDNSTIWRVPVEVPSSLNSGCPIIEAILVRGETRHRPGGSDPQIPYTLSPRMTYLLNDQPTFRWNGVEGATRYTVRLFGPVGVEWQTEVSSAEVVYPDGAPPLESGVKYLVTVEADNGRSSFEDGGAILGFELLYEGDVQDVREKAAKIAELSDLTDEEKVLALAELYSQEYLIADAIETLEALVAQGSQTAFVYLRLGDLYGEVGLNLLAEARYSKAIELFTATQDQYGLAEAQTRLTGVKHMLDKGNEPEQSPDRILTPRD